MKRLALFPLCLAAAAATSAYATEGGVGRPITGLQATSYAGLIPPTPGWNWDISYAYYDGTIGASKQIPLTGGGTSLGLDGKFQLLSFTGLYIWNTKPSSWNYASMVTVPFADVDVTAKAQIGRLGGSAKDSASGLFDVFFAPVIASHHFNETQHVSVSLYIYAPTGEYEKGQLANVSLNNWTFSPTVGYTQLFQHGSLEWSLTSAVDFYTKDNATDYQNGAVFRIDSLLIKRLPSGWGFGAVGGWIEQIADDTGPTADRLNGFKGRSLALGPMATYLKKWQGGQVEFSFKWLHEFDVKNRLKGSPAMLSASISL
ncbi:SphA family protein [Dyella sp. 20L07]|uniref:SphA family protein n=1 Tax=Dyella sp. 20L07 TaxID=3384240 RepID=UPI003D26C12D